MRLLAVLCAAFVVAGATRVHYDGYKVYRLKINNVQQLDFLHKLRDNPQIDFWSSLRMSGKPIDVMVNPEAQVMFIWLLNVNGITSEILINDVETVVQRERSMQVQPQPRNQKISFTKYNRFDEINAYLDQLAQDYPDKVTVETIGTSYEGRSLNIIKISTNPNAGKPVIFIDAGIHAREWIAPAMAQYIINQLVENEENSHLLEKVDWHILPVMNPDGYEFTHDDDGERFWRKTRSPQKGCIGTDGNRNFDFHWGEVGASSYPCSYQYMGPTPFSEKETKSVEQYIIKHKNNIKLYLTFHSFGNYLLYPWGFTDALPEDDAELRSLAEGVNAAIVDAGGDPYTIGTSTNVMYPAAGGSDDWAKGVAGIQLSYTIELPGGGRDGFDPSPSDIIPFVTQTFPGVEVYGEYIAQKFGQ